MKRIFGSRADGLICIGPWIPPETRSISCFRPTVTAWLPKASFSLRFPVADRPRVINVDGHPAYPGVIDELKKSGELGQRCRCRPSQYMNNVIEQDHRFVKKRVVASQWFRSVEGALNTIAGYEAMNIIRKGQIRWLPKGDIVGQTRFIERTLGLAA